MNDEEMVKSNLFELGSSKDASSPNFYAMKYSTEVLNKGLET